MMRALIFDLGNVLVYFSHDRMFRQIGELVGCDGDEVRRRFAETDLLDQYEYGSLTTAQVHQATERLFERAIDIQALVRAVSDIFSPNESIAPLIEQLALLEYPLVLLSNTCDAHMQWVDQRFPVVRQFRRRVLSFQAGSCKPEPAIFEDAARAAGVPATDCFFTDDTPGHVEAARQLGFDAVPFRGTPQLTADLCARGVKLAG
jgi:putative hydrolase of the HAD superfamily